MITIFRKLRHQLLAENKFSKYLIYALGEIVLVVVGIMIALQMNSVKEERALRQKENDYLSDIRLFLEQDRKDVEGLLEFYEEKQGVYDSITIYFDQKYSKDALKNFFAPYLRSTAAYTLFEINSTAFDNMMSANDISIITNKSLRHQLSYYYSQNTLIGVQERLKKATRSYRDYLTEYFISKEDLDGFYRVNSLAPRSNEVEDLRKRPEFYRIYFNSAISIRNEIMYLNRQLNYINELIEEIDLEMQTGE